MREPSIRFDHRLGRGPLRTVCLPGLVPDGPETFIRLVPRLAQLGPVSVGTYGYGRFDLDEAVESTVIELERARAAGHLPVLLGVSIGGGIVLEILRRLAESGRQGLVEGTVLISPMPQVADLSPMLSRLVKPVLASGSSDHALQGIERGRALFRSLARGSVPVRPQAAPWVEAVAALTPQGLARRRDRAVLARIEQTLGAITGEGGVQRVAALGALRGLPERGALSHAPTILLWGSKERQTLDMDGPGTRRLCRPDLAVKVLPAAEVHWIYGRDGSEVPHASTIQHADAFAVPLLRFLRRLAGRGRRPNPALGVLAQVAAILPRRAASAI